jgi:S-adenosylmethionine decarboxylase proenzyme
MKSLGSHILIEFHSCDNEVLDSVDAIESIMLTSVEESGATLVKPFFHRFTPHGVSGICVVAESHFAVHTWPEHGYAAVDLFSCGEYDYLKAMEIIAQGIKSTQWTAAVVERGNLPENGTIKELELRMIPKTLLAASGESGRQVFE